MFLFVTSLKTDKLKITVHTVKSEYINQVRIIHLSFFLSYTMSDIREMLHLGAKSTHKVWYIGCSQRCRL